MKIFDASHEMITIVNVTLIQHISLILSQQNRTVPPSVVRQNIGLMYYLCGFVDGY